MDFDDAKENIQPLPAGRNASILQALLRVESPQELQAQRRDLEKAIHDYSGGDPLDPWYTYISWIEQSFPSGGKESGLDEVLSKCLSRFEGEERYYQDRRMIKLYIKFIDSHKNPTECYQQLYNAGIGTMVADLYICWAYYYDLSGNTRKADGIFRCGLACRAQPLEELQEAHQHFGFSVAQRVIYQDDDVVQEDANRQLQERRFALTSLRGYRRKAAVGSIRTGDAVRSLKPGTVQAEASSCARQFNAQVQVFSDENHNPNKPRSFVAPEAAIPIASEAAVAALEDGRSVVRSIIDAARNQENQKEPGPWNKAHDKKKLGKLFDKDTKTTDYGFSILEDDAATNSNKNDIACQSLDPPPVVPNELYCKKHFNYPTEFFSRNKPQSPWHTPVTIENEPDARAFPEYNKCMLYPRPNMEFQLEEYIAYLFYTKRDMTNSFTEERSAVWSTHNIGTNVRQYPNFAKQSRPQTHILLDEFYAPPKNEYIMAPVAQIYNEQAKEEFQLEELLATHWLGERNETIVQPTDMEETVCGVSERMQRRKSFFPLRKSMAFNSRNSGRSMLVSCINRPTLEEIETIATENEKIEKCVDLQYQTEIASMKVKEQEVIAAKESSQNVMDCGLEIAAAEKDENSDEYAKSCGEKVKIKALEQSLRKWEVEIADTKKDEALEQSVRKCGLEIDAAEKDENSDEYAMSSRENVKTTPERYLQSVEVTSVSVSPFVPFEIYEDATQTVATDIFQELHSPLDEFQFKTPALPTITASTNPFSKSFEIYTENPVTPPPNVGVVGSEVAGIYDPEETCTQTFNIFLRSQSVSTPIVPQKVASRQFGTLLHEIPAPLPYQMEKSEQQKTPSLIAVPPQGARLLAIPPDNCEGAAAVNSIAQPYSPPHVKQLSTILETSEHATTQGTHTTTGASTKSTISSPEFEGETNARLTVPHTELEPLQEQSKEFSNTSSKVEQLIASFELQMAPKEDVLMLNITRHDNKLSTTQTLHTAADTVADADNSTPGAMRLQAGSRANLSVFCDHTLSLAQKQTGNFSRLEERDDTASAYALRRVCFQEDKTETIPEMLHVSQQHSKFQEDKTETISKILFAPPTLAKFEDEKTGTIPKIPYSTDLPITMPCDVFDSDDSFEFFGKSPPVEDLKMKTGLKKSSALASAHKRSPLVSNPKRYCDKDTPELHDKSSKTTMEKYTTKTKCSKLFPEEPEAERKVASDFTGSFMAFEDACIVPETQPMVTTSQAFRKERSDVISRNSFIPDFSLIEETQPQTAKCKDKSNFILPNFSLIEETQQAVKSKDKGNSLIPNLSLIEKPQTQATETKNQSILRHSFVNISLIQETQPQVAQHSNTTMQRESFLSDFSLKEETQPQTAKSNSKPILKDSLMPYISLKEKTQPQVQKSINDQQEASIFSHPSVIKHTSPSNSTLSLYKPPEANESFLPDYSMVTYSQPANESTSRWRQQPIHVSASDINPEHKQVLSDFFMSKAQHTNNVVLNSSSTLKFLNDSTAAQEVSKNISSNKKQFLTSLNKVPPSTLPATGTLKFLAEAIDGSADKQNKLSFLAEGQRESDVQPPTDSAEQYFELNTDTEMFATSNSMIKNSTWLPYLGSTRSSKRQPQIMETSLHIKAEAPSPQSQHGSLQCSYAVFKPPPLPSLAPSRASHSYKLSFLGTATTKTTNTATRGPTAADNSRNNSSSISFDVNATELTMLKRQKQTTPQAKCVDSQQHHLTNTKQCVPTPAGPITDDDGELSIYFKTTPKTPTTAKAHIWLDESDYETPTQNAQNNYVHHDIDLDQTQHVIDNICVDPNVNPFNIDLINAFLEQIDFTNYIEQLSTCELLGRLARLQPASRIKVHQTQFQVSKLVGEGAYGSVYSAKETNSGNVYALKQERPPNYWEYYICLEVQSRLKADEMLPAYMSVDYALIGNNSSILISPYAPYGSIITVCNKVKKHTMKNVDEYVVMLMTCELLEIIDHLHAVSIIHADIKADNVLVMRKLSWKCKERSLQLIDFGVSIDMKLFKPGQTFNYANQENAFKCVEMREQRSWTYQLDLYGLAGVIHVLLFGKYMEIERRPNCTWMHKTHVPRYYNKHLWDTIFRTLLNVRDCRTLPNLQQLRALLKEELVEKEKYVCNKLEEFNRALHI